MTFAGSDEGVLLFGPGLTDACLHADDTWGVAFSGAVVVARGRDLEAHALSMTATFVADPGCDDNRLAVRHGGPSGFTTQFPAHAVSATYVFTHRAAAGSAVHIDDGQWFRTVPGVEQSGTFVVTFHAEGFHPATFSVHVPTSQRLVFDPGTSYVVPVADSHGGRCEVWALYLEAASLTVSGGDVPEPLSLQLAASFVPDAEADADAGPVHVLDTGVAPGGWWPPQEPNPHVRAVFCYDGVVAAATADVVLRIADGSYVTTADETARHGGFFELTFSELGFPSTTHLFRVPSPSGVL